MLMRHLKLIVILTLIVNPSAYAQTATLFGAIDVGIEVLNTTSGPQRGTIERETGNNLYGSRIGVLGKEDLGGGLSAVYRLEMGFLGQTGALTLGNRAFGREASVGLKNENNQLLLGRLLGPLLNGVNKFDPAIYANYGLNSQDPGLVQRGDNAIRYTRNQGPLEFNAFYSFGVDTVAKTIGGKAGDASRAKDMAFSAGYDDHVLAVNLVYDDVHGPLTTTAYGVGYVAPSTAPKISTSSDRAQRYVIEGKYKMNKTVFLAGWRHLRSRASGNEYTSNLSWAGIRQVINPTVTLVGAVYYQDIPGIDARPVSIVFQGIYSMSKKTLLYITASHVSNSPLSAIGVNVNQPTTPGANQNGMQIGITHFF